MFRLSGYVEKAVLLWLVFFALDSLLKKGNFQGIKGML